MTASIKLHQLESKISDLQTQHQLLLKERQQEISILISVVDLAHLDDKTLVGGLLFLRNKITTQDPTGLALVEAWRDAGEKFLRRTKPKSRPRKSSGDCSRPRGKQEEAFPQSPSEKSPSSKQTPEPQKTSQSPQK